MRLSRVEEVGSVPTGMFSDVRTAFEGLSHLVTQFGIGFEWPDKNPIGKTAEIYESGLPESIAPLTKIIERREHVGAHILFIVRVDDQILPGLTPSAALPGDLKWHRDGLFWDIKHDSLFVTADRLITDFKGRNTEDEPGLVLRYKRAKHRTPTNSTSFAMDRAWVKGIVIY